MKEENMKPVELSNNRKSKETKKERIFRAAKRILQKAATEELSIKIFARK